MYALTVWYVGACEQRRDAGALPVGQLQTGCRGADGTLRAWTPITGRAFAVKAQNWIAAANWNPAGTRIAVANFRDDIFVSDPMTGANVPIHSARGNLYDVAWSPAGDRLATASRGVHCVETLDAASGRSLAAFSLRGAYRVAWSPSGRYLAACGREGAKVWDTKTGALVVVISRPAGCIVWHPDEKHVLLGGDDGAIELRDAFTGKISAVWRPPSAAPETSMASETDPPNQVFDLRWSPDGRFVAFVTQDSMAGLLDARDGRTVRTFGGHTSGIWRVVWNKDGRRLATVEALWDPLIRWCDLADSLAEHLKCLAEGVSGHDVLHRYRGACQRPRPCEPGPSTRSA